MQFVAATFVVFLNLELIWDLELGPWNFESAASDDADNFQTITIAHFPLGKFRWRDGFAIVFHDDAARQEVLLAKKLFEGTRNIRRHSLAIRDDSSRRHLKLASGSSLPAGS